MLSDVSIIANDLEMQVQVLPTPLKLFISLLNFSKMKNFKAIESDYDYNVSQRQFSGKLTKNRYKAINRYVRKINNTHIYGTSPNGYAYRCGCEHDCCGCLSSQSLEFTYKYNQVVLTFIQTYNY